MEILGKIKAINPMESGETKAGKTWSKQGVVIDTGEKFNPLTCVTFFGDKADMLQSFKEGNNVKVSINVSSREFNGKWYHNIDGWQIVAQNGGNKEEIGSHEGVEDDPETDLPF